MSPDQLEEWREFAEIPLAPLKAIMIAIITLGGLVELDTGEDEDADDDEYLRLVLLFLFVGIVAGAFMRQQEALKLS